MGLILSHLRQHHDVRAWAYFEFMFMTGMRPEEAIALRWGDVDLNAGSVRVERAKTSGDEKPLKTYNARDVDLVARALTALEVMKPWTAVGAETEEDQAQGRYIFENPVTGRAWYDERSQRDTFWRPTLRACGIRWRRPYQTRHTYATNALRAGVNPTYVSAQMGQRANAKMLFTVYAKWIDGADRSREKASLEAMLGEKNFPEGLRAGHSQRGNLVGAIGLEPTTPTMSRWCSNQLSYAPEVVFERPKYSRLLEGTFQRRRADRTPGTAATTASTCLSRVTSAISTVNVIQAVPLTDCVCTPITFIFSLARARPRCRAAGPAGRPPRPPRRPRRPSRASPPFCAPHSTSITRSPLLRRHRAEVAAVACGAR